MGNKHSKGAAAAQAKGEESSLDSEEFWWGEVAKNLVPIQSCEEFCKRFNATSQQYQDCVDTFNEMIGLGPEADRDKPYLTRQAWLDSVPHGASVEKWVTNIWDCFDHDHNNQLSLDEWLVYDGIRKYGSLEQRVMGSFVLYDPNGDHKIQRDEIESMMRAAREISGVTLPEEKFAECLETLMNVVDSDKSGTLELSEVIKAARANACIAKIFNAV